MDIDLEVPQPSAPLLPSIQNVWHDISQHIPHSSNEQLLMCFRTAADLPGGLSQFRFRELLQREFNMSDPAACLQLFSAFDRDKSGHLTFEEFAGGLSVLIGGTMDEKLQLAFNAYDVDGNGMLSMQEVLIMMRSAFISQGNELPEESFLRREVVKLFDTVDRDRNGQLDFTEFRQGVLIHKVSICIGLYW